MSYVPTQGLKHCRRCSCEKDVQEFRVFRVYGSEDREYRRSWCKNCERTYSRDWRKKNPGYHADWSRAYRALKV